jgi:hypothetical protein
VVDLERQQVRLDTWRHALRGAGVDRLLYLLQSVPGLDLVPQPSDGQLEPAIGASMLGHLTTVDGRSFGLQVAMDEREHDRLAVLEQMVESYGLWGDVERTLTTDIELLTAQYPDLAALLIFPRLTPEQILTLAVEGRTVPAGITRFIVPGRILRLNAPLDRLASGEPLDVKRRWLADLLRAKLASRQVRYYEEPVVLLDE